MRIRSSQIWFSWAFIIRLGSLYRIGLYWQGSWCLAKEVGRANPSSWSYHRWGGLASRSLAEHSACSQQWWDVSRASWGYWSRVSVTWKLLRMQKAMSSLTIIVSLNWRRPTLELNYHTPTWWHGTLCTAHLWWRQCRHPKTLYCLCRSWNTLAGKALICVHDPKDYSEQYELPAS